MRIYRLPYVLLAPGEGDNEEDMYLAEIPILPGCQAWGESPAKALEYIQSVAAAFIESYREHGDQLPPEVEATAVEEADRPGEVLVAL